MINSALETPFETVKSTKPQAQGALVDFTKQRNHFFFTPYASKDIPWPNSSNRNTGRD